MRIPRLFGLTAIALSISACGTPTPEYQISRCKTALDSLDILAARQPHLRMDIDRKKLEFTAEFDKVKGLQGEEGSKQIGQVCYRIEQYEAQLNPQPQQVPAGTTTPGGKLGATPGQPGQIQPQGAVGGQVPPAGGKLGATPGAQPGVAPAGDSGFGGAGTAPGTAPAPAPQGGSGFGGAAPAPGTAPAPAPGTAPAPAPAPGGGGFGGQ